MLINTFKPFISETAKKNVADVLNGTQLAEGPVVEKFEKVFAERFGFNEVVMLNSGTSALELAYELAGVGLDDEVITPVLTCTATNLPILHRGATPIFADITDDLIIDVNDIEKRITPKTKAIVYVHFGGYTKGLKDVQLLAKKHNIPVIEDAAQVIGALIGEWGTSEFTCISLQAIKTLTSGDGGVLICKNKIHTSKAKRLRWFGYDRALKQKEGDCDLIEVGYKYHMNDISAALGLGNLLEINTALEKRKQVQDWYKESGLNLLIRPWLVILVHPQIKEIESALAKTNIKASGYHYRNDKYTIFGGHRLDLPKMNELENNYTVLPCHQDITKREVELICSIIKQYVN